MWHAACDRHRLSKRTRYHERMRGSVFRADHPDHRDLAQTVEASREEPGRFNTSRVGAIYVSREPQTAVEELRRNHSHMKHPCALFVVSLSTEKVLDLCDERERSRWGLTLEDLTGDDVSRCQEVAESAVKHGVEAVIWPSATGNGRSLAVYAGQFGDGSHVEIVHAFELTPTVLSSVEAGASIAAIHPLLSNFPLLP
jgi:RES domain-containing protein